MKLSTTPNLLIRAEGYSLLEVMVALLLLSITCTTTAFVFITNAHTSAPLTAKVIASQELNRIDSLFNIICRNSQSHYGIQRMLIGHSEVLDLHGRTVSTRVAPAVGQSSISVAELEGTAMLTLIPGTSDRYCSSNPIPRSTVEYLAVQSSGVSVRNFTITQGFCPLQRGCRCEYRLEPTQSQETPLALFPVTSAYSLYLDAAGTLRYRSLLTTEDQPISYGFEVLEFRSVETDANALLLIHAKLSSGHSMSSSCILGPSNFHFFDAIF